MGHLFSKDAVSVSMNSDGKCKKSKAIGIDLGTTYSCVGVWQHDSVEIIANDQGNRTTPSMAAFSSKFQVVGDGARFQIANNPNNTIFNAKRLIGRRFSDPCVQADIGLWPFTVVSGENDDKPMIQVSYEGETKLFSPEDISAMVLSKMKKIAEDFLNCDVRDAVITVPAYFSDSQKRATRDAGKIAGLNVMKMINEPTAAAICYGFHASAGVKKNVFVFDLGGGTFDASIVGVEKGKIEVKAVGGDMHLGGEDFDNRLLDYCVKEFKRRHAAEKDLCSNGKALRRLRAECERAKRSLSSTAETVIDIDSLHNGQDFHVQISRAKFEELNADLFIKCMQIVRMCLEDAKMSNAQIDEIVLVGGSSRIPKIQELLGRVFVGKKICKSVNPDEAVAYGAAVQAAVLSKEKVELEVVEVAPLSLGVEVGMGVMSVVVPRNTRIPTRMERSLTTLYDNQRSLRFPIYEGERALVADNNLLGRIDLVGVAPMRAGIPKAKVYFEVGVDGILTVSAMEEQTGKSDSVSISSERRSLSKEEIDRRVAEASKFRFEDDAAKEKQEARCDLQCYVYNMKSRAMEAKNNEKGIIKSMEETKDWLEKNDCVSVEKLQLKLKQLELECKSLK